MNSQQTSSSRPICKRCLLREMSESDQANIEKYMSAITVRVSEAIYESRLSVCKNCDMLNAGTCNACGCYVELRALGELAKCPHKKW